MMSLMSWQFGALLLLGGSTVLLFVGIPVAFAFLAINLIGAVLYLGGAAGIDQIVRNSVVSVANFSLTPIPLFVLMGEILFHTGLALKVIEGIERLIRQVPGRLAVVAVVAGTVFSAISGSTIATTAMLGSLMLGRLGYTVLLASDGQQAIDVYRANRGTIDLVLLDLTMPRMDGLETFRALRSLDPRVRVVISSGYTEQEAESHFAEASLAGFLRKPYTMDELSKTIRTAICGAPVATSKPPA